MKFLAGAFLGLVVGFVAGRVDWAGLWLQKAPVGIPEVVELPMERYTIERLAARTDWGSAIELGEIEATESGYIIQKFYFDSDGDRVSGLAHIPDSCEKCSVVAQFRGYYDRDKYYPGAGTRRTAAEFAKAGFVSMAPDFLGYGGSASPSADVFEARFQTYTTAVNLLHSIKSLAFADTERVGIWGHSNGGHIALTALEITGGKYPTVLWAPVTAPFPYSILYYMDDYDDRGKALRNDLASFEDDYDVEQFTLVNFLDKISGPILFQQGTADPDVPLKWSRGIVSRLKGMDKDVEYIEYPGADHNLVPSWSEVVKADIEFYGKYFK